MPTPHAHTRTRALWVAGALAGAGYGVFLVVTALRVPAGAELTGQFTLQPAVKALMAVLLTGRRADPPDRPGATLADRGARVLGGRRLSAGDAVVGAVIRARPGGVSACAPVLPGGADPLATPSVPRLAGAAVTCVCAALLVVLAEALAGRAGDALHCGAGRDGVAALLARLPTPWTARLRCASRYRTP